MAQTSMTFRVDDSLKKKFDALCDEFGLTSTAALTVFMKAVVRESRIPFQIQVDPIDEVMERGRKAFYEMRRIAAENGTAGMSLEEINEEIRLAREGK